MSVTPPELIRNCKRCSHELPLGALVCDQCHSLVHSEKLEQLTTGARALDPARPRGKTALPGGGRKTAEMLGVPFLGEVPIDPKVVIGGDTGEPIVVLDPQSAAAQAFTSIAAKVVEQIESGSVGHTHADREPAHTH